MAGMVRKILRAAVAQPWEYVGGGAPADWEFRVSPDEEMIAVWNPGLGRWVVFSQVVTLQELTQGQGDRTLAGWSRFVEELEDE